MMDKVSCPMNEEGFTRHMQNKAEQWLPKRCDIGKDFAVFGFPYVYKLTQAVTNLKCYAKYYGYRYLTKGESLVIINTHKG